MPGVGKTYFGSEAAKRLSFDFYDLDKLIELRSGKSIAQLFMDWGEVQFREFEFKILKQISEQVMADTIISTGGGAPTYVGSMHYMNKKGKTVWMEAEMGYLADNILKESTSRPHFMGLNRDEIEHKLQAIYSKRHLFYAQSCAKVNVYKGLSADLFTKHLHLSTFAK